MFRAHSKICLVLNIVLMLSIEISPSLRLSVRLWAFSTLIGPIIFAVLNSLVLWELQPQMLAAIFAVFFVGLIPSLVAVPLFWIAYNIRVGQYKTSHDRLQAFLYKMLVVWGIIFVIELFVHIYGTNEPFFLTPYSLASIGVVINWLRNRN